jgi:hypothetical protein
MTQNVHEPSAHEDWRDRSKQSLLYIPSVHMVPAIVYRKF